MILTNSSILCIDRLIPKEERIHPGTFPVMPPPDAYERDKMFPHMFHQQPTDLAATVVVQNCCKIHAMQNLLLLPSVPQLNFD